MFQVKANLAVFFHDPAGYTHHGSACRHIFDYYRAGADHRAVTQGNRTQDFGAGSDQDVVTQGRMPLLLFQGSAAQDNTLVEEDVISDFSCFPDYHAHSVVDKKPPANHGAG